MRPKAKPKIKPMTRGERVIAFIERFCYVPEGKLVGKLMELLPFEKKFILDVYDNPHMTTKAILSMGRKNGKTTFIAAIALAHIVGPEAIENSQIATGAMSQKQAALIFKAAFKMLMFSPILRERVKVIPSEKKIIGLSKGVEFQSISAEAKTALGLSPVVVILDETGQVRGPNNEFIEALETAQGAYDHPILFCISTQPPNDSDLMAVWIDDQVNNPDPHVVCHIYSSDMADDINDPKTWEASNPALGVYRSLEDMENLANKAVRMPSFENVFRNLNLNQRVLAAAPFVSRSVWDACKGTPIEFAGNAEIEVFGGLDLSGKTDLTSLVLSAFVDGIWHVRAFFWAPTVGLHDRSVRDKVPYETWAKEGYLRLTPGPVVDYEHVVKDAAEILEDVNLVAMGFDRWRMDIFMKEMERWNISWPMVNFGQGYKDMTPAIEELEGYLLNSAVRHGGHPILQMCAANVAVDKDPADNRKFTKKKSTGRIDGMVALVISGGVKHKLEDVLESGSLSDDALSFVG